MINKTTGYARGKMLCDKLHRQKTYFSQKYDFHPQTGFS